MINYFHWNPSETDLFFWSLGHVVSMETGEAKLFLVTILVKPCAFQIGYVKELISIYYLLV